MLIKSNPFTAFPEDFIHQNEAFAVGQGNSSLLKIFRYSKNGTLTKSTALTECKEYCGEKKPCCGCSLQCNKTCQWNALTSCDGKMRSKKPWNTEMSVKPSMSFI